MKLEKGQRLLFTGDSITDCGRNRPPRENIGLGDGYVNLVHSFMSAWYPQNNIRILNTGISGNRVTDLEKRWQIDVLNYNPDWLSVMIGINDVWRQFDSENHPHDRVDIIKYENIYRKLLEQTRPNLTGLILMTPFFIEPDRNDPMRAMMDTYSAVVKNLAHDYDAVFVDTQATYDSYLEHRPWQTLCDDRVHPNQSGHMLMAKAFLTAMEFNWV